MMLRLIVILIAFSVTSCLELPDLKNNDGTPASATEIRAKFVWAWGEDPATHNFADHFDGAAINLNEVVSLSKTVAIVGTAPREYEQQSMKMHAALDSVDDSGQPANEYRVAIVTSSTADSNNQKPPIVTEHGYFFPKSTSANSVSISSFSPQNFFQSLSDVHALSGEAPNLSVHNMLTYLLACRPDPASGWNPTCYNLKTWTSVEAAPVFLQREPGCGGLVNCQMNVRHLAYDLVSEVNDAQNGTRVRMKTLIHLQMSPDVPYLSRLTSLCFQGLGKFESTPYVATVCTDVTRFERGTPR